MAVLEEPVGVRCVREDEIGASRRDISEVVDVLPREERP
jgi:hypothetical protein